MGAADTVRITRHPLLAQLRWFISLRWIAGSCVVLFALADRLWLNWYDAEATMLVTGVTILAYNVAMWAVTRGTPRPARLIPLAWAQIILDLAALTVLTVLTGGLTSPIAGFYVFHMIFASLLLPRGTAWAMAGVASVFLAVALGIAHGRGALDVDIRRVIGWIVALLLTVYLANNLTRSLRRQHSRLVRQNRAIRRLSRNMRRQRDAMARQEKMAALGQMAAGITHEIANPLASMDSLLQLLQRKPERVTEEKLQTLRTQIERINQIVRQMTTFAHPDSGQWEAMEVNDITELALEMLRFDKRLKAVRLVKQYSPSAGRAKVMPQAIQQVLINVIGNALDAMAESKDPELCLRTGREGKFCTIAVIDCGHGIAPENLTRIFEPFFTTKPLGKGTGLGLSISYSLMEKQGGSIRAENRKEGGCIFTIRLPAVS